MKDVNSGGAASPDELNKSGADSAEAMVGNDVSALSDGPSSIREMQAGEPAEQEPDDAQEAQSHSGVTSSGSEMQAIEEDSKAVACESGDAATAKEEGACREHPSEGLAAEELENDENSAKTSSGPALPAAEAEKKAQGNSDQKDEGGDGAARSPNRRLPHKTLKMAALAAGVVVIAVLVVVAVLVGNGERLDSEMTGSGLTVRCSSKWSEKYPDLRVNSSSNSTMRGKKTIGNKDLSVSIALVSSLDYAIDYRTMDLNGQKRAVSSLTGGIADMRIGDFVKSSEIDGYPTLEYKLSGDGESAYKNGRLLAVFYGNTYAICAVYYTDSVSAQMETLADEMLDSVQVNLNKATVTFLNDDGSEIKSEPVEYADDQAIIKVPDNLTRPGYVIDNWKVADESKAYVNFDRGYCMLIGIQGDVKLSAVWKQAFTVTFTDGYGNVIATQEVASGESIPAPQTPQRDGEQFAGWDQPLASGVTSDTTINATWTKLWTVTFVDGQGNTLKTQQVADGQDAAAPSNPTRSGYTFEGWDGDYKKVTTDRTITATWRALPTKSQANALKRANQYLNYTAFSYKGLVEQLEFEQFSHEDAVYAADWCGADWNQQAAKKAQQYLDYTAFSRGGLIDQLEFEGFTHDQAVYGVDAVGL